MPRHRRWPAPTATKCLRSTRRSRCSSGPRSRPVPGSLVWAAAMASVRSAWWNSGGWRWRGETPVCHFSAHPVTLGPLAVTILGHGGAPGGVDRLHQRREPCERRVATCLCVSAPSVFPIYHWRRRWSGWQNSSSRPWRSMSTREAPTSSPARSRPITRRRSRPAAICSGCGPWRSRSRLPRHPNSTTASRRAAVWPSRSPSSPWWSMPRNSAPPSTGRSSG